MCQFSKDRGTSGRHQRRLPSLQEGLGIEATLLMGPFLDDATADKTSLPGVAVSVSPTRAGGCEHRGVDSRAVDTSIMRPRHQARTAVVMTP